ncbi:DUF924 family protein [Limnoraphis robusta Tam1]|uniref:DUF924 family protein n=1 Tax=Limnoraphis robusta CCNP1315 TaxID=3110306 RepID=A0ABU5TV35_9CYAN|nr:DUF924 family protein [Limnoraphis robusta]MEA5497386.1 DUF924 family protein [Limnoraphis robusta BA-68 BA1]MEA5518762.1 DUF924 family protein [Limnoraphis robusta CCNP1315]MEA5539055.1 DUF924 family protein [Limnoraphis robusta Tam1]MEA5545440.1 DUF924 family protein [Limnoraphis robusta CCNP1324]
MSSVAEILAFWFGSPEDSNYGKPRKVWFQKNSAFDEQIRSHFLADYELAAQGQLDFWKESPDSCLALILLFDQFPRNVFRGQAQAFVTDTKALEMAKYAVSQGFDRPMLPVQRWFIYLPFEHSENLADQEKSVELMQQLSDDPDSQSSINYAIRHWEIIKQFGRFPHRNAILGRESTPEEEAFLQQPGSSF